MDKIIIKYGKKFFFDSSLKYTDFKKRLTTLKKIHPRLKYHFIITGSGKNTRFTLYVRRWGL